jgi:hypothetical protein
LFRRARNCLKWILTKFYFNETQRDDIFGDLNRFTECSILSWNLRLALGSSNLRSAEMKNLLNAIFLYITVFCNFSYQVSKTREIRLLEISEIIIAISANNSAGVAWCTAYQSNFSSR